MKAALLLSCSVLLAARIAAPAALAQPAGPFDGAWNVTIVCANAPDGAAGYTLNFVAQVRGGTIDGRYSNPRTDASALLSGQIRPDGGALLKVDGTTGHPEYTVGRVQPGTPYHYTANARFGARSGSGSRNELRRCDLSFSKT